MMKRRILLQGIFISYPRNAILEFDTVDSAVNAQRILDQYKVTPKMTLDAVTFDQFNDLLNVPNTIEVPEFLHKEELLGHLADTMNRNQIIAYKKPYGRQVGQLDIMWHNEIEGNLPEFASVDGVQADTIVPSQSGAYVAAINRRGVTIYGGPQMKKIARLDHKGCQDVKFSCNDTYIATYNGLSSNETGTDNLIAWNIFTEEKLRQFKCTSEGTFKSFDWSCTEKYAAAIITNKDGDNFLCIYDSDTMNIVENSEGKRRPVQVEYPQKIAWANTRNQLVFSCYSSREGKDFSQAGVYDADKKNMFNWLDQTYSILNVEIAWEENDRFITILLDAKLKEREMIIQVGTINYKMNQMNVIVKTISPDSKHTINGYSIDKLGRNIALFVTRICNTDNKLKPFCDYFKIRYSSKLSTLEIKNTMELVVNEYKKIIWGSLEDVFVLHTNYNAAIGVFKGFKKSISTTKGGKQKGKKVGASSQAPAEDKNIGILNEVAISPECFMEFDPTGRYLCIYEHGIQKLSIYNAYGFKSLVERVKNAITIAWRPLPKIKLPENEEKEIKKLKTNTDELVKIYSKSDENRKAQHEKDLFKIRGEREKLVTTPKLTLVLRMYEGMQKDLGKHPS